MPSRRASVREIEIKLRVTDPVRLLRALLRLGAHTRGRVFEQNTLYDTPDAGLRRRGWLLRLRTETPAPSRLIPGGRRSAAITSKMPPPVASASRYKERLEREWPIAHPRRWPRLLRSLGFRPSFRYEKYRSRFRLPGLELDLDETPIGVFLELEGAPAKIDRVTCSLGYAPRDYLRATYGDLWAAHARRRGHSPRDMLFPRKNFAKTSLFA